MTKSMTVPKMLKRWSKLLTVQSEKAKNNLMIISNLLSMLFMAMMQIFLKVRSLLIVAVKA